MGDWQAASDLRTEAYRLFGVDVMQIPGLENSALRLFSEVVTCSVAHRSPLRFLVRVVSGQRPQWRQGVVDGSEKNQEPRGTDVPSRRSFFAP